MKIKCPAKCFRECEIDEHNCLGEFYIVNGMVVGCNEIVQTKQISKWFVEQLKDFVADNPEILEGLKNDNRK